MTARTPPPVTPDPKQAQTGADRSETPAQATPRRENRPPLATKAPKTDPTRSPDEFADLVKSAPRRRRYTVRLGRVEIDCDGVQDVVMLMAALGACDIPGKP